MQSGMFLASSCGIPGMLADRIGVGSHLSKVGKTRRQGQGIGWH